MSPEILRKLSDSDLRALSAGDMSRVSTAGLQLISGRAPEPEKPIDPTEGMSGTQKVLANIGGGMMDLVTGVKQLYTDVTGTEEEKAAMRQEVESKRKRDEALAASTPGGKLLGKSLQVAGSVAPTLALPVGAATRAITSLPRAAGVMSAAPTAARLGTGALATDAAVTGGALGAIAPVGENESRGVNVLQGAALSGAAPLAIAGGNQVRRMVTQAGGGERAAEQVARELGGDPAMLQQTIQRLRQAQGQNQPIPLSVAAQLSDPQIARLEAGSRARSGADWYDFDQAQARAVSEELMRATRGAENVGAQRAARSSNRDVLYQQAMSSINEPRFTSDLTAFRANLDAAAQSAEASNPAVRGMLTQLAGEIDRLGPNFGPEHLATIRANLASKAPMMPTNAYQAAPRESPATMSVLREVDNILNNATNNRWQNVLSAYKRDSDIVRSTQAAGKVRESFIDPATGRVRGVSADVAGDVPKITEAGMGRALDTARGPRRELVLDPTANARLEAVLGALRQQGIVQGVKRSATAGGGSNTASDTIAAQAAGQAADVLAGAAGGPAAAAGRGAINALRSFANENRDRALAEALQNPQRMIQLIEQQLARGEPLSPLQQQVLAILRGAPAAAGMSQ
jgi:hypothetical protein